MSFGNVNFVSQPNLSAYGIKSAEAAFEVDALEEITFSFDHNRLVWIDQKTGKELIRSDTGGYIGSEASSRDILDAYNAGLILAYNEYTGSWGKFDRNTILHKQSDKNPADLLRDISSFQQRLCQLTNKKD